MPARTADITEENIQSRIRGTLLMALSNKFGALVLTTGNKSEMAVGYCTLYGDMVGALAVIGDLVKTRVYAVCRWLNRDARNHSRAPSSRSRLRPNCVPARRTPTRCRPTRFSIPSSKPTWSATKPRSALPQSTVFPLQLVQQVVRLVERSEYKRQQAAPVLKVTSKSFGMGRRFPIAVKVQV